MDGWTNKCADKQNFSPFYRTLSRLGATAQKPSPGVFRPSLGVLGAEGLGSVGVMYGSIDGHTDVWIDKIPLCILNDIALLVQCPKMFDKDI